MKELIKSFLLSLLLFVSIAVGLCLLFKFIMEHPDKAIPIMMVVTILMIFAAVWSMVHSLLKSRARKREQQKKINNH